jgi:branched-subunit amino acid aminotransferase/4-amino-4-deoxychorismate lyase
MEREMKNRPRCCEHPGRKGGNRSEQPKFRLHFNRLQGRMQAMNMEYKKWIIELIQKCEDEEKLKLIYRIISRYLA